jgi:hypothetical protein|tara:strand:- start:277 stop:618 length:342 start_codon:yes stop_codon:yes gene_type:complete
MPLAQNVFQTVTKVIPTSPVGIYTAPIGYTGVVLLAQAANVGDATYTVSMSHQRTTAGIAVTTEVIKDLPIESSDTANLLAGKLVLEQQDSLIISSNNSTNVKFLASILETLN